MHARSFHSALTPTPTPLPTKPYTKDEPKSFETDAYAIGVTLWEIYERRTPFGSMPEAAVVSQVLSGTRPNFGRDSATPKNIRDVIEACWVERPQSRPTAVKVAYILSMEEDRLEAAESSSKLVAVQQQEQPSSSSTSHIGSPKPPGAAWD